MKWAFIGLADSVMRTEPMFQVMEQTTEGSMHHREANVLVHTQMVLCEYFKIISNDWNLTHVEGAFACLFHDVGKPAAEIDKFSEERGAYHSYPGHEIISARAWENWAVDHFTLITKSIPGFNYENIYHIGWMIEHHLPYSITNSYKLECIYKTGKMIGGNTFANLLTADGLGRINDNAEVQAVRMKTWLDAYQAYILPAQILMAGGKHLHMVIGPSGCGKTSLIKAMVSIAKLLDIDKTPKVFSLDELRVKWYADSSILDVKTQYEHAHNAAVTDPTFVQKWQREFMTFVKAGDQVLIIDGTNLITKHRRFFLDMAKSQKYKTHGVYITSSLNTLKTQQKNRKDKVIDLTVYEKQYALVQYPSHHEFDFIEVV